MKTTKKFNNLKTTTMKTTELKNEILICKYLLKAHKEEEKIEKCLKELKIVIREVFDDYMIEELLQEQQSFKTDLYNAIKLIIKKQPRL